VSAEPERSGDVVRRAFDANLQYYAAVGRITVEYWQALAKLVEDVRLPGVARASPDAPRRQAASLTPTGAVAEARPPAAIVLEAAAGGTAEGLFLVDNSLQEKVSAPVFASSFRADDGREVTPKLVFEPEVVTLGPGEQILVRAVATIDERLEPNVGYRGELSVPGVAGTRVAVVLRRTLSSDA
jgi:hypothetical protein